MTSQEQRRSGRKWRVFRIRFGIDVLTIGVALVAAILGRTGAEALLIAGFGDMSVNVATYFAANVAQKRIVAENYRPELVGK